MNSHSDLFRYGIEHNRTQPSIAPVSEALLLRSVGAWKPPALGF